MADDTTVSGLNNLLYSTNSLTIVPDTSVSATQIQSGTQVSAVSQNYGNLASGKTGFNDFSDPGYILGVDSNGQGEFLIGNGTNYLQFDGTNVTIVGNLSTTSISIPNSMTANSFNVDSSGNTWWGATTFAAAPASISDAGVAIFTNITATGTINAEGGYIGSNTALTVSSTGLNVGTTGYINGGQTDFNTGAGFFLGYSNSAYQFSIGDGMNNFITWNGTTLAVGGIATVSEAFTSGESISAGAPVSIYQYVQTDGGITYDNSSSAEPNPTATITQSFIVGNNSNRALVVFVHSGNGAPTVTYNGVSMTQVDNQGYLYSFILIAPSTGANNLVISNLNATRYTPYTVFSYYNVAQTGQPDVHNTGSNASGSVTKTLATASTGSLILVGLGQSGTSSNTTSSITYNGYNALEKQSTYTDNSGAYGGFTSGVTEIIGATQTITLVGTMNGGGSPTTEICNVCLKPYTAPEIGIMNASSATQLNPKLAYLGIAPSSIALGATGLVTISGIATGLSGLTIGSKYYVQDTKGTLGTSAGTTSLKAIMALSSTTALITNIW